MSGTDDEQARHLDPQAVEDYFHLGVRTAFRLSDEPDVLLLIDPERNEMELSTPAIGSDADVTAYERISAQRTRRAGVEWFRLTVDATDMRYEAYTLLESVADQIRAGASFRHAVAEALDSLRDLLASRRKLTDEKVLGLIGELIVLRHVIARLGEESAISAWLGPRAEEHDFGFPTFDAEVKTTKSESRVHVIGSDTQLEPSPGQPLYLVSIQVTRAGAGREGFTLPALIADVRGSLGQTRRTFDSALEGLGWRDADADLYHATYRRRSVPRGYEVDDQFPAITSARLDQVVPRRANVVAVSYRVDVTHLDHAAVPAPLDDFCEDPR